MEKPVQFTFASGRSALAIRVQHTEELPAALHELGLENARPVLVLVGGAGKMDIGTVNHLRSLFVEQLVPTLIALNAMVVDGGTDAGVMQLMGQARASLSASFPLIGVAAINTITIPGTSTPHSQAALLEPHHSHFVLVPGTHWGDESPWLCYVGSILAARARSMTMLINGGEISWQDVEESVKAGRPVLVIKGSGRTADALAEAVDGGAADDRARRLAASSLLRVIDMTKSSDELAHLIREMLSPKA